MSEQSLQGVEKALRELRERLDKELCQSPDNLLAGRTFPCVWVPGGALAALTPHVKTLYEAAAKAEWNKAFEARRREYND